MSAKAGYRAELRASRTTSHRSAIRRPARAADRSQRLTQYVYYLYQRASIAGDLAAAERGRAGDRAGLAVAGAQGRSLSAEGQYCLQASPTGRCRGGARRQSRRLATAKRGGCFSPIWIFSTGAIDEAERGYRESLATERSWGGLARLAHLRGKMGDPAAADRLYSEAEDELTAKEMRSYAWLEVQRGFLAFAQGDYPAGAVALRTGRDRLSGVLAGR